MNICPDGHEVIVILACDGDPIAEWCPVDGALHDLDAEQSPDRSEWLQVGQVQEAIRAEAAWYQYLGYKPPQRGG